MDNLNESEKMRNTSVLAALKSQNPNNGSTFSEYKGLSLEVVAALKSIIAENLKVSPLAIRPTTSFKDDLGIDSLETVELLMDIEKEFNIEVPEEVAERIQTVGDVMAYLEENL